MVLIPPCAEKDASTKHARATKRYAHGDVAVIAAFEIGHAQTTPRQGAPHENASGAPRYASCSEPKSRW